MEVDEFQREGKKKKEWVEEEESTLGRGAYWGERELNWKKHALLPLSSSRGLKKRAEIVD